ncbi:chromate transporter [Microvirga sp. ACRRW]|uniref:chromate transporter n=1 Tax=Microvirga sp. ACRRW TaxID=2918205 RepID=UPI001EF67A78|nr:chromate transporter [Microvirga sp. ACRRW]MCG7391618.1 chromate transporter [Microvirga sp. ACRRW]
MNTGAGPLHDGESVQAPPALTVSVTELFRAFLLVGLSGFGGVLPFVRHMLVEKRRWLTASEFTEVLGLSQLLPGPNVVNISIYVGARFAGIAGATSALLGLMVMPVVLVLCLGAAYTRYGDLPAVANAFRGVASAAAGLVVAMAAKIAWPVLRSGRTITIAAMVFIAMAIIKVPLVWTLAVLGPVSILWIWWRTP